MIGAMAGALPQLILQGQDPSKLLTSIAQVIKGRQEGKEIEILVQEAFMPEPAPQGPPGVEPSPGQLPQGASTGPTSAPPGASGQPPAMEQLLAGMNQSGNPRLSAGISRQTRV